MGAIDEVSMIHDRVCMYSCRVNNVLSQFSGDMREKKFIVKKKFVLPLFQNRVFPLVLTVLS